jgi:hypothetical protein
VYDFGAALALAQSPGSGVTLDDLVYFFGGPHERFDVFALEPGLAYLALHNSVFPDQISLLDAFPTYRPGDVLPQAPLVPFLDRAVEDQPFVLGSAGGWPKSLSHGVLGSNDLDTVPALGQPFLQRDAAFHPDGNPIFDDGVDYRGRFAEEFVAHHAQSTLDSLASEVPAERVALIPTSLVPVSDSESIQNYRARYCPQDETGACVDPRDASTRPWIEQILYERFAGILAVLLLPNCPLPPEEQTLETKPAWDVYYACFATLVATANAQTEFLLEVARDLGQNPAYAFLNVYGPDGGLNPGYWTDVYLQLWILAKGPVPLPSYGFSMEVESVRGRRTPKATLKLRRSK